MKTRIRRSLAAAVLVGVAALSKADVISKENNTNALSLGSSWVGGVAPGTNDVAAWDVVLTTGRTYSLGADVSWLGLAFTADPNGNIAFNSGNTLTLGASGIYSTLNKTITLNNALALVADQTWYIGANTFVPQGGLDMAGQT